jgi:hypothetical protein
LPTTPDEPFKINWHDGVLVEFGLSGFAGERQEFTLVVELYPDVHPASKRRRYDIVGANPSRFVLTGDLARLIEHRQAGNIDYMRMDYTADKEILVVQLFGAMIEVEAASFRLTESPT